MARDGLAVRVAQIWQALGSGTVPAPIVESGAGDLPSCFDVTDLAAASIGAAAMGLAEWRGAFGALPKSITVDRRLASLWFGNSFRPIEWAAPPIWDALAGDYAAADGWIRLHTNAPHHRLAALSVLGQATTRQALAPLVLRWPAEELEAAVVAAGGCAAAMRSMAAWGRHPVGSAVAGEPLIRTSFEQGRPLPVPSVATPERPLRGIRVLDLTRILAGPIGTRFLAGYGADVLRIDPPGWDEGVTIPEVTLGKRCARLDLTTEGGRKTFLALLAEADVFVHGYRADALERLGLGAGVRRHHAPAVVDVALNAYGWNTDWTNRRGFDSLVQMSAGIASEGMARFRTEAPKPLPVQALDHATGYLIAAAALRGLTERALTGRIATARLSLARTAALLCAWGAHEPQGTMAPASDADFSAQVEPMDWGRSLRLRTPVLIEGAPMVWQRPATALGTAEPHWLESVA